MPSALHAGEKAIRYALYRAILALALLFLLGAARAAPAPIAVLSVTGAIGPASADYVNRGITRAATEGAQLVILKMDTPGGLDTSMRSIIKTILASQVPVATYVAPGGARAASAGTYILYASHLAAMAPGTNLGAATPVQVGGGGGPGQPQPTPDQQDPGGKKTAKPDEDDPPGNPSTSPSTRKQVNDAAAYIRGLAEMRGRNIEWAERAVREAVSLSSSEALKQNVIEVIAADLPALLQQIDGRQLEINGQERVLQTAGAPLLNYEPDWRVQFLAAITDPSIALLLMTIGMYGLIFEFMNPGFGVPGVLGAICLLIGMYALQMLPVNYAGLALILLGVAFMVAEAFVPSFGILGLGGVAAFVTGAVILIDTDVPGFGIPVALIVSIAVFSALLLVLIVGVALKTRRRAVVGGPAGFIDSIAEVIDASPEHRRVRLHGEIWQANSNVPLKPDQKVRVTGRQGLVLDVTPIDQDNKGE